MAGPVQDALLAAQASLDAVESPVLVARGGGSLIFRMLSADHGELAIKVPAFDRLPSDRFAAARAKLRREGIILGAVDSSCLPRLVELDAEAGYLAREYIAGETLQDIKSKPALDRQARLRLCADILRAADNLFKVFHFSAWGGHVIRDFKPRNLIRNDSEGGRIVLVDVGGVRSESTIPSRREGRHRIGSGSWRYWPPEQLLEQDGWLDRRVDYFALGSTLHTLLFGTTPYTNLSPKDRLADDYAEMHADIAVRLRATPDLPEALAEYIIACVSPDPLVRPQMVADPAIANLG